MTSNDAFLRNLERWLDEQASDVAPDYLDEVTAAVGRTRQQPSWSSLEHWLPIDVTSIGRRTELRRLAWIAVLVVALAGLIAAVAIVGAQRRLPAPFGFAGNGQIAIANMDSIVVAGPDSSRPRLLVMAPDGVEALTWSPDGTRLAYSTLGPESRQPAVLVVSADGAHPTDVTAGWPLSKRYDEPIAWAPDSARLVVPSPVRFETALLIANADGSGSHLILDTATSVGLDRFEVGWSPDGQWISFVGGSQTGEFGPYLVHPDGTGERLAADMISTLWFGGMSWAPDPGVSRLLFVHPEGGITVIDIATGRETRLEPATGSWPTWSPDGRSIAWWSDGILVGDTDRLMSGSPGHRLIAGPESCTDPRPADPTAPCGPPVWSPDGRWLFAPSGPGTTVVAISADGSAEPIVIPLKPGTALNPVGSAAWQRVAP